MIGHARTTHAGWRVKVSLSDSIFDVVEFSREKKRFGSCCHAKTWLHKHGHFAYHGQRNDFKN
jgi:hypothetical protein